MWNEQACLHIQMSFLQHIEHTLVRRHRNRNRQTQANTAPFDQAPVEIRSTTVKHKSQLALTERDFLSNV